MTICCHFASIAINSGGACVFQVTHVAKSQYCFYSYTTCFLHPSLPPSLSPTFSPRPTDTLSCICYGPYDCVTANRSCVATRTQDLPEMFCVVYKEFRNTGQIIDVATCKETDRTYFLFKCDPEWQVSVHHVALRSIFVFLASDTHVQTAYLS